ncbi:hypothetical protein [Comamonas sp. B21-038]|uniref:hypothetical protein n=1 Tax=Comamonas sp. B21-038 TaxID=2918299 RepID=UPI00406CDC21
MQLQLSVNPSALKDDSFDVCFRFGPPPDARVIAKRLAAHRHLLSASPTYLAAHCPPQSTRGPERAPLHWHPPR